MRPEDFVPRVNFLHRCVDEPDFPRRILFTDEAKVTREDVMNFRSNHVRADENPLRTSRDFSNSTVSTCGQGFWVDVLFGHTFFHLISSVTRT